MSRRPIVLDVPGLDEAETQRLVALVADAADRQSTALDDAIERGLGHIPRLLRGTVKAVLFR